MSKIPKGTYQVGLGGATEVGTKQHIETLARAELERSDYPPVRRVRCHFQNGILRLRGRVSSYYLKQVAQTLVLGRLQETAVVQNDLEVVTSSLGWHDAH